MSVDYEVLNKFLDVDTLELEYHRVTNDIRNIDIEYGIEIILGKNRYGKSGSVKMGVSGDRCKIYSTPEEALTEVFNG